MLKLIRATLEISNLHPEIMMNIISTEDHFPKFRVTDRGLHHELFIFSIECAGIGIAPEQCLKHLTECVDQLNYHRHVPEREITEAVKCAYQCVLKEQPEDSPRLPRYEEEAADAIYRQWQITLEDLRENSVLTPPTHPLEALEALFKPEDLICIAGQLEKPFVIAYKNLKLSLVRCRQFMVPHPMKGKRGLTKDGKPSKRCTDNTGPRARIVCDFDLPKPEIQPSLICHLMDFLEVEPEYVVHSGNKSLQAAWNCTGWPAEVVFDFESEAVRVGADPAIMGDGRRCQFVRMPAGYRDNGKRQVIHFWNPHSMIK